MRWGSSAARLVVILAFSVSSNGQNGTLTMSGVVTDKQSHTPIQGATVTVVGNKANQESTDTEGSFMLRFAEGVREGEAVRIHVEKSGYRPYDKLVAVTSAIPLQVSLLALKTASPLGVSAPETSLCHNQNPVRIISIPGRKYEPAVRIHTMLKERGCKVEGTTPFPVTDTTENPANNEVRYFHQNDKDDASHVAEFMKKETNGKCDLRRLAGYSDEPKGQLEIWIKQ